MNNIYDYIENIRKRPGMFSEDFSLVPVETLLHGYWACLDVHTVTEAYEGQTFTPRAFSSWLCSEKGWSTARGFAQAIEANIAGKKNAWDAFFELVREYRYAPVDVVWQVPQAGGNHQASVILARL